MTTVENDEQGHVVVGDEKLNEKATAHMERILGKDETLVAVSGFDWDKKVLAITDQRVLITGEENDASRIVLTINHDDISLVTRDGRTLIIGTKRGVEHRHRFGNDQTVEELVEIANNPQIAQIQMDNGEKVSIAEKVRFWEEQDKINQELIPSVVRQNKLLTQHIADHENLPLVAGNAVSQALAEAREEQGRQYQAALDAAKAEQWQQYQADLAAARQQLNEQTQDSLNQALATMREESRKTRNIAATIAAGAVAIAIVVLILGILV